MNMFNVGAAVLLCGTLASCATNPLTQTTVARPSIGDFTDHVLEPLALRVADEKIIEATAGLKLARTPKGTVQTFATLLYEVPWVGKLLSFRNATQKAQLEEDQERLASLSRRHSAARLR